MAKTTEATNATFGRYGNCANYLAIRTIVAESYKLGERVLDIGVDDMVVFAKHVPVSEVPEDMVVMMHGFVRGTL